MEQWEYVSAILRYESEDDESGWQENGQGELRAFDDILNAYGVGGWELVSLSPEWFRTFASSDGVQPGAMLVTGYHATFKKRRS